MCKQNSSKLKAIFFKVVFPTAGEIKSALMWWIFCLVVAEVPRIGRREDLMLSCTKHILSLSCGNFRDYIFKIYSQVYFCQMDFMNRLLPRMMVRCLKHGKVSVRTGMMKGKCLKIKKCRVNMEPNERSESWSDCQHRDLSECYLLPFLLHLYKRLVPNKLMDNLAPCRWSLCAQRSCCGKVKFRNVSM